jgi:hypothetical protein
LLDPGLEGPSQYFGPSSSLEFIAVDVYMKNRVDDKVSLHFSNWNIIEEPSFYNRFPESLSSLEVAVP